MTVENRRILVIDDMESIRADFAKILGAPAGSAELTDMERRLFGRSPAVAPLPRFELGFAAQGLEGVAEVRAALARGEPYATAFVDVRMPPGLDGVETVARLWELDPRLEVAVCTAFSDYSWQEMLERLDRPAQFLLLAKPFDATTVRQTALALTEKWNLARAAERSRDELDALVRERTRQLEVASEKLRTQLEERLELERHLQHAHKLQAVGRFVAGVAHEITNPIAYVLSNLAHADRELAELEPRWGEPARSLREVLADASVGGKRIQQIVQDLTAYSRPAQPGAQGEVSLEEVLRGALRMAGSFFPDQTRVEQDLQPVPPLHASAGLLSQVFVNLLSNAGRALSGVPGARRLIRLQLLPLPRGEVRVTIRDYGTGIPEAILHSVFDPFFTTRPPGEGTGLGLYISHGIVERMGGAIRIESREGEGTSVEVDLPLAPPARAVERPPTVGVLGVTDTAV